MADLYEPAEPFDEGMLDVGDGNQVYWQTCGNPAGKPAVVLHGGPGQGSAPNMRRGFDPDRYLVVMVDQRGCGRSLPHASDPATDMSVNTTPHLVADLERLREHLGFGRWMVTGGSWGSTLGLAYAEKYPHRVTEIVLTAITTSRRSETDWLYRGAAIFFPEAHQRFLAGAGDSTDTFAAYLRRTGDSDEAVRIKAALDWREWEDAVLSLEPGAAPIVHADGPSDSLLAFVRICASYALHGAWLEEGALIRDATRLAGIPAVLIHGRLDLSCPAQTAWELANAWPDARLMIDDNSGHRGGPLKNRWLVEALDSFAAR